MRATAFPERRHLHHCRIANEFVAGMALAEEARTPLAGCDKHVTSNVHGLDIISQTHAHVEPDRRDA